MSLVESLKNKINQLETKLAILKKEREEALKTIKDDFPEIFKNKKEIDKKMAEEIEDNLHNDINKLETQLETLKKNISKILEA